MKLRQGFVSNSSSSSFIIKLDKPIEDYTLDEFRKVCKFGGEVFDPVKKLYDDLLDTKESKRDFETWEDEYKILGKRQLGYCEYVVEYEDHTENGCFMEHDFTGDLPITEYCICKH